MSQRQVKMVRRQIRKTMTRSNKDEFEAGRKILSEVADLPLKNRIWFSWRILTGRYPPK